MVSAAREVGVPVIVGVSESEREFMSVREVAALVRAVREESSHPVFLNADHTHTLEKAEEAARAGFDSIVFRRLRASLRRQRARDGAGGGGGALESRPSSRRCTCR